MNVYIASPLGFAKSTIPFMDSLEILLKAQGIEIFNPWRNPLEKEIGLALSIADRGQRIAELRRVNNEIGRSNEKAILECDIVVAILDGTDVDSGTASEIGFAYAKNKRILGLRTDFRLSGDNEAAIINLQVQYWIEASSGKIVRSISELQSMLNQWLNAGYS